MWQDAVLSEKIPVRHIDEDVIMQAWGYDGAESVKQLTS